MATVFKRDTSPFFFACYVDRLGKQVRRTTKSDNKAIALKMALEWERVERLAKDGQASVATFQKIVAQVSQEVMGDSVPAQTIRAYFQEWLTSMTRKATLSTMERYKNTVRLFLKALGGQADQPLRSISPRHIELFLNRRLDEGAAPKTAIVDIKTLGSALRRAENFSYIDRNPVPAVKLPKSVSTEREVFTLAEIYQLVAAAPNEDWQTLILLGFYTGARLGDCMRMTWENVYEDRRLIIYQQEKTGKIVPIPVHPDLILHLGRISDGKATGPLCRSLAAKSQAGKHGLSESFKRIVRRSGLDLMVVKGKGTRNFARRTFHSLRHSISSTLAAHGVPEEQRMRLTGHSSRDIHQKYTHYDVVSLQKAMDSIPSLSLPPAKAPAK